MILASDARNFKDELDILRNKCEKMVCLIDLLISNFSIFSS
jgi:hypothetical protein